MTITNTTVFVCDFDEYTGFYFSMFEKDAPKAIPYKGSDDVVMITLQDEKDGEMYSIGEQIPIKGFSDQGIGTEAIINEAKEALRWDMDKIFD